MTAAERIAAIRRRAESAFLMDSIQPTYEPENPAQSVFRYGLSGISKADVEFIANARKDIYFLLSLLETP